MSAQDDDESQLFKNEVAKTTGGQSHGADSGDISSLMKGLGGESGGAASGAATDAAASAASDAMIADAAEAALL